MVVETKRYERNSIRGKRKEKRVKSQRVEKVNNKQDFSLIVLELVFHGEVLAETAEKKNSSELKSAN